MTLQEQIEGVRSYVNHISMCEEGFNIDMEGEGELSEQEESEKAFYKEELELFRNVLRSLQELQSLIKSRPYLPAPTLEEAMKKRNKNL